MGEEVLEGFHPKLQPFIKELMKWGRVGVYSNNMRIFDVYSGEPVAECNLIDRNGDRFKLGLPFAGQSVTWNVIFDSSNPDLPPDFYFDDDSFLSDPDVGVIQECIPSLANWDAKNPKALMNVILELLFLYQKHQISQLNEITNTRLQYEYNWLISNKLVKEEDVEILCNRSTSKTRQGSGAVSFMIRLKIDFSGLPPIPITENIGEDAAILLITFHPPNWTRITPQISLSPVVETALGGPFHVPPFPQNDCLLEYVPTVIDHLKEKINSVILSYEKKKEFIGLLVFNMGKALLEYDSVTFLRASFLLERRDFYFILHITVPGSFPKDKPTLVLQSIYHVLCGKPFRTRYDECPYSPRWEIPEIVQRTLSYITENIESFQKNSIQSSQT